MTTPVSHEDSTTTTTSTATTMPKAPSKRCGVCSKRLGLLGGFECRCGGTFCPDHRLHTEHGCSFDYKTMERDNLRKQNPVVESQKITRF